LAKEKKNMWSFYVVLIGAAVYLFYQNIQDIEGNIAKKEDLADGKDASYTIDLKEKQDGSLAVTSDSRNRANVKLSKATKEKIEQRAHSGGGFVTLRDNNKGKVEEHVCYANAVHDKWVVLKCRK
jgi:hypothetical protein